MYLGTNWKFFRSFPDTTIIIFFRITCKPSDQEGRMKKHKYLGRYLKKYNRSKIGNTNTSRENSTLNLGRLSKQHNP